ncbi:expressed unknown protein [Seminavis robusta]|uniref:Uncharacterized protein n=1 Tax=Seminavis robusta TaxID=568900 RepID=A0A9N8H4B7_9STRA|nr:expressed unknown protein [Seminavis robusta]|eukprot:Sro45_g027110.1 n/a (116) ;mRNA; f:116870-117387
MFGNKLSTLFLTNNSRTGRVPTEVGLFDGVTLGFGSNCLSGSIPTELFQAGKGIQSFYFNDNKLTGTLPTEIGASHVGHDLIVALQVGPIWMAPYQRNSSPVVPTYLILGLPTVA